MGVRSVGCGCVSVRSVINKGSSCIWRQMYLISTFKPVAIFNLLRERNEPATHVIPWNG